jgi:ssDNA-binding Zn-finger/Zn-ribbon topoisomerase 1
MKINDEIMKKVAKKEEENRALNRCLAVNICPKCGGPLACKTFNDGGKDYICSGCNRVYH